MYNKKTHARTHAHAHTHTHTNTHTHTTHTHLATLGNRQTEEGHIPDWLMTGATILISKNENTERPKN